jgi:hypothetical protein
VQQQSSDGYVQSALGFAVYSTNGNVIYRVGPTQCLASIVYKWNGRYVLELDEEIVCAAADVNFSFEASGYVLSGA